MNEYQRLNEGLIWDKNEELASFVKKLGDPDWDMMSQSLALSIGSQLGRGIQVKLFPFWKRRLPAVYNFRENKIYLNSSFVDPLAAMVTTLNPFMKEKNRYKVLLKKNDIGLLVGGICYYGIHAYNIKTRGSLISNTLVRQWYRGYLYRSLFGYTQLTTISQRVTEMMYNSYLNIIKNYYELRSYTGRDFTDSDNKQLNYMFTEFSRKMVVELRELGFDQMSISKFEEWFSGFMHDLNIIFMNNDTVVMNLNDDFMIDQSKTIKVLDVTPLYGTYKTLGGRADVEHDRFPAPAFRELYATAEPLAQIINSLARQNKLKDNTPLQDIASRGIAYLS